MPSSPVPTLMKDALIRDKRMLYLHSCKKIFLHRDYTAGLGVKFETAYPEALRGMISENTWQCTIGHINKIFSEAEEIGCASIWETVLGCLTCYFSRIFSKTIYEKKLAELNDYLEQQNSEIYIPANVYILNPMERGLRVLEVCLLGTDPHSSTAQNGPLAMLSEKLGSLIQEGLVEGQRFALSSDLWRYASSTAHCDLLIILQPIIDNKESATAVTRLVDIIKQHEPGLRIQVRHHRLKNCFALYLTADYKSLLKGAELCHIKKTAKPAFGGGLKEFCFEDAQCFLGIEGKNTFLTDMERTIIVKQMLDMIRAPPGGVSIDLSNRTVFIAEGMAILPRLMSANVIQSMLPLHNEQYLRHLQQKWVFTLNPTQQPLEEIKDYFGTEIAMYFSWLGHLTSTLWFPAILGLFMFFFGGFKYRPDESDHENQLFSDICFVLFAFFNCVWSTAYLESWKRKQAELAFKWGTYATGDPLLMDPRPGFQGDYMAPNPVSGRLEPYYPPWKHTVIRYCVTYPVTFLCVAFMFLAMLAVFVVQDAFDYYFGGSVLFGWICYLPMVVYALLIVVADKLYRVLALFLNELENYRTEDEYEDFLISKIVVFQSVTAFGSLFYIAFVIHDMRRLQETLATLLITRQITQKIKDTAVPFIMERIKLSQLTYKLTKSMSEGTLRKHVEQVRKKREATPPPSPKASFTLGSPTEEGPRRRFSRIPTQGNQHLLDLLENFHSETTSPRSPRLPIPEFQPSPDGPELNQAELESLMTVYARPLDDYLEIFIQFGYVLLFSPAFPLAAVCALINNLVEIRADAFKLSNAVQRPFARQVKDIGAWEKAMQVLGVAGVMVNCALIGQSGLVHRLWPDLTWGGQMLLVVLLEHLILAAKFLIDIVVPDIPHWIRIESAKQEHHRREAFKRESRMGRNSPQHEGTPPPPTTLARTARLFTFMANWLCCHKFRNQEDTVAVSYNVQVAPSNAAPLAGSHRRDEDIGYSERPVTAPEGEVDIQRQNLEAEDKRRDAIMARVE